MIVAATASLELAPAALVERYRHYALTVRNLSVEKVHQRLPRSKHPTKARRLGETRAAIRRKTDRTTAVEAARSDGLTVETLTLCYVANCPAEPAGLALREHLTQHNQPRNITRLLVERIMQQPCASGRPLELWPRRAVKGSE